MLGYLERAAAIGTASQRILDLAGALLFRGRAVEKRIAVLSGGERARVCLAGLLLGSCNVLVLDEPGNHLDVDTVDALAAALVDYRGTVIFTSHDRSFVRTVATNVIEARDGRVLDLHGGYDRYLVALHADVDAAEEGHGAPRERSRSKPGGRDERGLRRELAAVEKQVTRLEAERRRHHEALLAATDPAEALRLHEAATRLAADLAAAEEKWLAISDQLAPES